jgi:hypothetical protein
MVFSLNHLPTSEVSPHGHVTLLPPSVNTFKCDEIVMTILLWWQVNIIPVIAKADTVTKPELTEFKKKVNICYGWFVCRSVLILVFLRLQRSSVKTVWEPTNFLLMMRLWLIWMRAWMYEKHKWHYNGYCNMLLCSQWCHLQWLAAMKKWKLVERW